MLAFIFPGQGSQFPGMGKQLFEDSKMFRPLEAQIDRIAGFSIRDTCLRGDEATLKHTELTQPCLYIVNALHNEKYVAQGKTPHFLAGHSLGEINALQAAGAFDLLTGLRIVVRRGQLMATQRGGGMAAVIGLRADEIADALARAGFHELDIANVNTSEQVVISGPAPSLSRAREALMRAGAGAVVPLPVGAAFHSRYMEPLAEAFGHFLSDMPIRPPRKLVLSNVTARPYPTHDPETTIRALLVRQLKSTVRWDLTIEYLRANGVTEFLEVGPGSILTRMRESIRRA